MSGASPPRKDGVPTALYASVAGLCACLLSAHWPTLRTLENRWASDPQSSHGFLVPLFAAVVLWSRRSTFPSPLSPGGRGARETGNRWGIALFAVAAVVRLGGFLIDWFDGFSLLLSLTGLCVLIGGWRLLRWAWPGLVMLSFMLPLPYQIEIMLAGPLQRVATVAATYALQTLGYPALAEGNVIVIDDLPLRVEEACNGLGMLSAFFALSTAVALVMQRPRYEKIVVFLSAVPIALLVNLIRIIAMGWAYQTFDRRVAAALFHDYAGWLMMPLALLTLWLEMIVLKQLFVEKKAAAPVPVLSPEVCVRA